MSGLSEYELGDIVLDPIQKIPLIEKKKHIFLIDNYEINCKNEFTERLNNFYSNNLFEKNTKIHLKLKINLNEFIALSHTLFPGYAEYVN